WLDIKSFEKRRQNLAIFAGAGQRASWPMRQIVVKQMWNNKQAVVPESPDQPGRRWSIQYGRLVMDTNAQCEDQQSDNQRSDCRNDPGVALTQFAFSAHRNVLALGRPI